MNKNVNVYDKDYVVKFFETYLGTKRDVVLNALDNQRFVDGSKCNVDKYRLQAILLAIEPSCEKYKDVTPQKRKQEVVEKLLKNLKYDHFCESYYETYRRLSKVYNYTSGISATCIFEIENGNEKFVPDINVYYIIGSTMLLESNLSLKRNERKEVIKVIDDYPERMVWNIYTAVSNIGFSKSELSKIFEKNKTIFSKGNAEYIDEIASSYDEFTFRKKDKIDQLWTKQSFMDAVKKCGSILVAPYKKLKANFDYIVKESLSKIIDLKSEYSFIYDGEEELSNREIMVQFVKNAIKENTSLLVQKIETIQIDGEDYHISKEIDRYIETNLSKYLKNNLKIELYKEDDYDKLDETELEAKFGNNFGEGMSLEDRNAYYRIVGREDKIVEDDGLGIR